MKRSTKYRDSYVLAVVYGEAFPKDIEKYFEENLDELAEALGRWIKMLEVGNECDN